MSYRSELQKMFDLQKFGMKFGLEGMETILDRLGRPERGLKFVHLAGTNGKGSVGVMLHSVLKEAGFRTGLYTSPHLATFRERIMVGREMIGEDEVLNLSAPVWAATDPQSPPTFFEFVTAMAFLHFQAAKVDLAIIETGLGGRLDSTNVIDPLVTAITNVTLEHTEHLGDTVAKIASEKAGILKPGRPAVLGRLLPEALEAALETAGRQNSPVYLLERDFKAEIAAFDDQGRPTVNFSFGPDRLESLFVNLAGPHQADNAALALALARLLAERGFAISEKNIRDGLAAAVWPGRAETFPPGSWPRGETKGRAPLMLDGAHNPAGARALAATLDKLRYRRLHLVVGVMADKDIAGVLGPVLEKAHRLYLTRPFFSRAASPGQLWDKISAALGPPRQPNTLHQTIPEALAAAALEAGPEDLVLLSGSLFTVGEGRAYLHGLDSVESN